MYLVVPPVAATTPPAHETVETIAKRFAHEVGGKVENVEVPTTKAELKEYLNLFAGRFAGRGYAGTPLQGAVVATEIPLEVSSELPSIEAIQNAGVDEVTHILEAALERFAELGEPARESLESRVLAFNGHGTGQPSHFFQRAAMMMAVLALGEIAGIRLPQGRKTWGAGR
jgi:hypothetical protein